ncbi:hypothetical protein [Micromonospora rubida]|nr:hypothetical protein [Micromonospora rubida]
MVTTFEPSLVPVVLSTVPSELTITILSGPNGPEGLSALHPIG